MNPHKSITVLFLFALLTSAAIAAPQRSGGGGGGQFHPVQGQGYSRGGGSQAPGAGYSGSRPAGPPSRPEPGQRPWQNGGAGGNVARPHPGDGLRNLRAMTPTQQRQALARDPSFRNLPPQRQQQLLDRLDHFNNLPPERKQQIINRVDTWNHFTPAQQEQARGIFGQMQSLPEDRRMVVRGTVRSLRAMPPEARERYLNSPEYQSKFSPQERQVMRGMTDLNIGAGAARQPADNVPRPPQ